MKNTVVFNEADFGIAVQNGAVTWKMMPSSAQDVLAARDGDDFHLRLADAGEIKIMPYETGFQTGIKIALDQFRNTGQRAPGGPAGIRLILTICLEGGDEELIFESAAIERGAVVTVDWATKKVEIN